MKKSVAPRTVREVMTVRPKTVHPETSLAELKALFEEHDFNAFPVVDKDGDLVGLVTKLDLMRAYRTPQGFALRDLRAAAAERVVDVMTRALVTVSPEDPVAAAVDLMVDYRLQSLPVTEHQALRRRLLGIVSRGDIMPWLVSAEEQVLEEKRG